MGKQRRVSASYDDEFDNLVAKLRDDKEFANKYISEKGAKLENHFVQENFSNSKNNDYLDGNEDPHNFRGGLNLNNEDPFNDLRADRQSSLEHLGIGAVRTVAKATTEVLKLPGVIGGIAMSPFAEENEGFETAFNNQWIKFFDGLNEDVKEAMPVYVKEAVKNGDFFTKIGSSATWATEGADGAGYMLGALAPGGLFKYFGGAAKIFGTSAKAAKLGMFSKSMEAGRKVLKAAGITTKNIDQYMIPAFNTIAEAGAESKGVWDGMESRKGEAHAEYMSKLNPNDLRFQQAISLKNEELEQLRRAGEISIDEYNQQSANIHNVVAEEMFEKDFKEQKALAAQNTFFKNAVILAGPNYIQAKLLFGKTPSKVLLDKIGGLGEKSIKNTVKQGVKNFAKGFASEGAEEVGQSAVEHRNIEEGLKFNLGNDRGDDYNPLTFGDDFIKTLGTTEGQMAGFLGGIMGAPMSAVGGYAQDKSDRKQTERLREKINGASTAYADIKNTNIYEQEEYTNPETGEVDFRDKEVDGKKVFIPENVAKVKKALDLIEKDSNEYDNAVEDGDVDKIEEFRNKGEFNVIANFIGEDEVTLDALHEHLKVAFPTETSKDISDEQVKVNKTNLERIDKIMKKAKHLQKDFVSFKDMSASILRINHPNITKESTKEEKKKANEHLEDFLNRTAMTFLSERGEEYEAKQVLNKLEQQKSELENNSTKVEIENVDYIEGKTEDIYKQKKVFNNPRLELVNTLIDKVKEQLEGYEENTNRKVWDNEYLNKQFAKEVEERKQIQTQNSPEQVAQNDAVITAAKNATTEEEVAEIEKNAPKEVITNPVIKNQIDKIKEALAEAKRRKDAEEIATATQEDNDFNDTTTYSDLNDTEGSPVTDELIPQQGENNSTEELKSIDDETVIVDKGAQVISTHMKTGELFPFVSVDYLKYEREPVNKAGKEVSFEINTNPGPNENLKKALKMLKDKDFSDPAFLISYLPINVVFEKGIKAPMESRRASGDFDVEKDKNGNDQYYINPATKILRKHIINHLINGGSISDIKTTIQDQYKGLLKVDDNRLANNNILELDGVPNLKYVRDNLYVVDSFGNLKNIQTGKTKPFINDKVKSNAKGEIYLEIPQANGKPFPLKLNIKKLDGNEADTLASIYSHILKVKGSSNMTLSEVKDEQLIKDINEHLGQELKVIIPEGKSTKDVKLGEIIDLLVYESDNIKSRINITNDVLYYGENEVTSENIDEKIMEVADFLNQTKRHQIKIEPKFATDNTKTNLKSNSADYLNYLINNNILSTNAVVNEPTFQGYTNIYLNTGVTINNQTQSNIETKKVDIEKRRQEELKGKQFLPVSEFNLKKGDVLYNLYANTEKVSDTFTIKAFSVGGEGMKQYLKAVLFIDNETKAEKWWNSRDKFTWNDLFIKKDTSEINAKYDAELAALNQPKVSDAGVEVNTDNTGITEMFEGASEMGDDVLDILKDFETEPKVENKVLDKIKSFTENKSDIKVKKTIQEIPRENISFFVSGGNGVDHQSFPTNKATSDYDINSTLVKLDGFRYIEHSNNIISFHIPYNGLDVRGGAHLGIAIKGLKLTEIDEKSIKQTIDKLGNALSKISKNVTGDERFDKIKKIGNQVIDTELANLENKSENTRNSQESFVSLSEMKGTMENTELNKTQAEVFNENKNSSSAREDRLLQRAFDVFKKDPNKLSAIQKERLDEYKQKYPEAYKKKCQ